MGAYRIMIYYQKPTFTFSLWKHSQHVRVECGSESLRCGMWRSESLRYGMWHVDSMPHLSHLWQCALQRGTLHHSCKAARHCKPSLTSSSFCPGTGWPEGRNLAYAAGLISHRFWETFASFSLVWLSNHASPTKSLSSPASKAAKLVGSDEIHGPPIWGHTRLIWTLQ